MAANVLATEEVQEAIRAEGNITGALNGSQGHVSEKTVNSVQFMGWGLLRLANILRDYGYQALNRLSCMTLEVENCHATVHSKKVNMSKLKYARSFGATMKESIKINVLHTGLHIITPVESKVLVPKARHNGVSSKCTVDDTSTRGQPFFK